MLSGQRRSPSHSLRSHRPRSQLPGIANDIRKHPALKALNLPRLGQPGRTFIGVLTTKNDDRQ
jgi:hypothetical protein